MPLLREGLKRAQYAAYLSRLTPFQEGIERELGRWVADWPVALEMHKREKAPLLRADLIALGEPAILPSPVFNLKLASVSHAWGCLYVLEGSTLGGQVLSRRLSQSLGLTPSTGGAFLWAYGDQTGEMWRRFQGCLLAFAERGDEAEIIRGAQDTFESLTGWLKGAS